MKNLLVYVHPSKKFNNETEILVRIQVDNSLDLGWKKEDIIILTNFKYEYNGVKAEIIDDNNYCEFRPLSTRTCTTANLDLKGTYWSHDFDAYQLNPMEPQIGFTDYGWSKKWCLGSYFFDKSLQGVFKKIKDTVYKYRIEDERALAYLTSCGLEIPKINITYNFGMRHIKENYEIAEKPLKVLHFHPWYPGDVRTVKTFMYGKNPLRMPLMNQRLINIFNYNGIK